LLEISSYERINDLNLPIIAYTLPKMGKLSFLDTSSPDNNTNRIIPYYDNSILPSLFLSSKRGISQL